MSTAFHPQMDRALECSIRTIAQILHSMILPDPEKDWAEKVEFVINSSMRGPTGSHSSSFPRDICLKWHKPSTSVLQKQCLAFKDLSTRCETAHQ